MSGFRSAAHSDRWKLSVDGEAAEHAKPFGWANSFEVPEGGEGKLSFETPKVRYALLAVQALLWLWILRSLLKARLDTSRAARGAQACSSHDSPLSSASSVPSATPPTSRPPTNAPLLTPP